MPELITFAEAIAQTAGQPRSVLLGNGFSIAQAGGNFSYANLLQHSGLAANNPVRRVFDALGTIDFEEVTRSLEHTALVEGAYNEAARSALFQADAGALRDALIHAVRAVHPAIQFEVPEAQITGCATFLQNFESIFTLNYDLLLYWVIVNAHQLGHADGFGLGDQVGNFRTFSEQANCSTHYLHGALHLFLNEQLETQKRIAGGQNIIDAIAFSIQQRRQLPMFVAEGTSIQKKSKIYSIPYLRHCYEKLSATTGSLFVFGHSVSERDAHIYDAAFASGITKFVFFVHRPQDGWDEVVEKLAPYGARREDVEFLYVDAANANVWGAAA
jgi:hypothetical protein